MSSRPDGGGRAGVGPAGEELLSRVRPGEGAGGRPSPVDRTDRNERGAPPTQVGRWRIERVTGLVGDLLGRPWPSPPIPSVWFLAVERPALVLGSTQPDVSRGGYHQADFDVVRRRSGGGAVLVEPGNPLWMDVLIPAGDRHWEADVGRAFLWLGDLWVAALAAAGVAGAAVHRGPPRSTPLARTVCFAGLGTGEVTVDGRKVVGISQRRTRHAALFQCAALLRWDPARVAAATGLPTSQVDELAGLAAGVPVAAAAIEQAVLQQLATH